MRVKSFTIAAHVLIWLLLFVIPYVSTDQVFNSMGSAIDMGYLSLCASLSGLLIIVFYINYFILIPRYLLLKRYWLYFTFLAIAIFAVAAFAIIALLLSNFDPETLAKTKPAVEKIIPVIIVNAILIWFLSIVLSILWTTYHRLKLTEAEKLSAQIASLRSQINPHFLFNTLNSIYATVIDVSPKTADMVDRLSEMMRYTMKETHQDSVLLEREISYIDNYIALQKLRLDRRVKLEYSTLSDIPALEIAPMLLIPFVENAFKHGVNSEQKSRIRIEITMKEHELLLSVVNNKVDIQRDISESSGLGIENTKHRLNLIYPSKHLLVMDETKTEFSVSLSINLQ